MKTLTFAQFQASKKVLTPDQYCATKPDYDREELVAEITEEVFTYYDGSLTIQKQTDGNFELDIENCGYVSENLEELEKTLFLWALAMQYFKTDMASLRKWAEDTLPLPSINGETVLIGEDNYFNGYHLAAMPKSLIKKLSKADRQLIYNTFKIDFFYV